MVYAAPVDPIGHWSNRMSREIDRCIAMGARNWFGGGTKWLPAATIESLLACRADGAGPMSAIGAKRTLAE
jgi:hypothetical protein